MTIKEKQDALKKWQSHCAQIKTLTPLSTKIEQESAAEKQKRLKYLLNNYDAFCAYYFPHFLLLRDKVTGEVLKTIHNATFHNEAARKVKNTSNLKAVFMWPRGHAKSTHFDVFIPIWLMFQEEPLLHVGVIVGKSEDNARTLLADLQAELENNQRLINDFGRQKGIGNWQEGHFVTAKDIAWFARGRGQSPRGLRYKEFRPDYIVIDDIDDDELCRNERRVKELTQWVKEALFGALDVGRGRFIMVGNLISKTSVLSNIAATKGVYLSKIKAVDKDGDPVWKDKWTQQEAMQVQEFMGYRAWQKEMMHNPIHAGSIFKNEWIRFKKILPLNKYDELICYTDPSFKSTTANDYKASRLWGKKGSELHLIDCYVRQDSIGGMVNWLYNLYESLPEDVSVKFMMESNFLQDIILDEFAQEGERRGYQLPITGDRRKKPDKLQRIESISPLWERGFVFYNEKLKGSNDMDVGIEQTLSLERGSKVHDDAPDADEGAIYYLQKHTRLSEFKPIIGRRETPKNYW